MSDWKTLVREDREAVLARDPAAKSMAEVRLCYPGLVALKSHRRAHALYEKGHVLLARWISQRARHRTGIEIHPGLSLIHILPCSSLKFVDLNAALPRRIRACFAAVHVDVYKRQPIFSFNFLNDKMAMSICPMLSCPAELVR